ncbi:hypothetical protein LEP1GSC170_0865 [Leptospira interrogans serovar Bataviae str. HAI135]|nr:hypothetical protein LEP1GSC170_0865 [Leptospira interrogans serovar Bataviae str. HAI135]
MIDLERLSKESEDLLRESTALETESEIIQSLIEMMVSPNIKAISSF